MLPGENGVRLTLPHQVPHMKFQEYIIAPLSNDWKSPSVRPGGLGEMVVEATRCFSISASCEAGDSDCAPRAIPPEYARYRRSLRKTNHMEIAEEKPGGYRE